MLTVKAIRDVIDGMDDDVDVELVFESHSGGVLAVTNHLDVTGVHRSMSGRLIIIIEDFSDASADEDDPEVLDYLRNHISGDDDDDLDIIRFV